MDWWQWSGMVIVGWLVVSLLVAFAFGRAVAGVAAAAEHVFPGGEYRAADETGSTEATDTTAAA
jgi:hypothetical protein